MFHIDAYIADTDAISDELAYGEHPFDADAGSGAMIDLAHEALIYDLDPLGGSVSPY